MRQNAPTSKPGPRGILSVQVIVDAALRLLDDKGPDAMSMRGIATELGVAPNALYTYFPDKAAVLRAVVDRLIGEHAVAALAATERPWRQRIHDLALELRAGLLRHPGAAGLVLGAPMDGPQALALGERLLDVLAEAGLDQDDAARASYLVIVYLLGFVALEAAEVDPTRPAPPEDERVASRQAGFDAVSAAEYPRTAASAGTMARYITTEQFAWGLDRLLDGLQP
ncbi:TetR/AcrR family transcriptional regulator [Actinoplanes sp. NPDC049548]|uniref:TetR/AcrR family transcriptional regulator n=1 Tax=Actinoplanes sp. NPDC049548 TaxID=3155152 RepID=UPI003430DF8C